MDFEGPHGDGLIDVEFYKQHDVYLEIGKAPASNGLEGRQETVQATALKHSKGDCIVSANGQIR